MKMMYEVIGTRIENDKVRLFLKGHEAVKEKESMESVMTNPLGYIEKMKQDAIQTNQPQSISVSYSEWEKYKWNIGDVVNIEVTPCQK